MKGVAYSNRNEGKRDSEGKLRKANWQYRFECAPVAGKRKFIQQSGFATKQDAINAGTKAYNQYNNCGSVFKESGMSYSDCLDCWMKDYVEVKCVENTQAGYKKRVESYIRPELGKYQLTSIRRETVQKFINDMHKKKYSRNTLVNVLGIISNSLRFARRQGWIEVNPAEDIDLPTTRQCTKNRHKEREPVPRDVLEKIFIRFPEGTSAHVPLMLAYHCGMRLGEVYGLTWDKVDLDNGIIYVEQQVQWSEENSFYTIVPPKYGSSRRIKMDNTMWELLKREKERQEQGREKYAEMQKAAKAKSANKSAKGKKSTKKEQRISTKVYHQLYIDEDNVLNTENQGKPIYMVNIREDGSYVQERTSQHYSQVIKKEIGYEKFDFHSLRHTHATELSEAGVNIKEIQRRLGHSTMEVTSKRYLHATDQMEEQSVELMNEMFKKVQSK